MSTRSIASLMTECETRFKDTTNRVITEAEWSTYIAEAWDDIVAASPDWPFLREQDQFNITFLTGNNAYILSDVLIPVPYRLTGVYNATDETPMAALPNDALAWELFPPTTAWGAPTHFQFIAKAAGPTVLVYPTPARSTDVYIAYQNETSTLHGVSTNNEPPIPNQYLQILVHGALARAYVDDQQWDAAAAHQARADMMIERMRVDLLLGDTPGYPGVRDTF